jgi:mRNA-degrading endonuclease RelE of RelBE toxin-antitoxin system
MAKIKYETTAEFDKDLKKLVKKYRSLLEDLEVLKRAAIELYHLQGLDNHSVFPIPSFCTEKIISCKVKKFASKSFKGKGAKSGLRLIYIYLVEEKRVVFIEIYYKGIKENEDKDRLHQYFVNSPTLNLRGGERSETRRAPLLILNKKNRQHFGMGKPESRVISDNWDHNINLASNYWLVLRI